MRLLKIMLTTLILGGLAVPAISCGSESDSAVLENQVVTVQRGNLTIDITAAGNLALSRTEELAFDIFYPEATVEEVLVEEGDTVEEGQVVARLDTSEWEDNIATLEDQLTVATRELTAKERALATKERDLLQAQINLQMAEDNLDAVEEVAEAQEDIDDAEYDLKFAEKMLLEARKSGIEYGISYWMDEVASAKKRITEAERELAEVLAGNRAVVTDEVAAEVAIKKLQVDLAQKKLEAAYIDVEDAKTAIEDARKDVEDAQEALDEALEDSPEVVAPFDGFIISVNVEGGDEVMKGTVAVVLADPAKFEADILVSEMDILQVKMGGEATVQVDAMQGLSLPAKVTHIAPTATIQAGVVNYEVKVEVESLEAVMQERQEAMQEAREKIAQGELPEQLKKAIKEGRITQEQAEEMVKQKQQGEGGLPGGRQGQVPTMLPEDFQLREGLTVTVSILVEERNNVLLVPSRAITSRGTESVVLVLKDGVVEERLIKTGISDYQNTEVINGLTEGEQVVIPQAATTTPTTPQPKMPFFPGGPPPPPPPGAPGGPPR